MTNIHAQKGTDVRVRTGVLKVGPHLRGCRENRNWDTGWRTQWAGGVTEQGKSTRTRDGEMALEGSLGRRCTNLKICLIIVGTVELKKYDY